MATELELRDADWDEIEAALARPRPLPLPRSRGVGRRLRDSLSVVLFVLLVAARLTRRFTRSTVIPALRRLAVGLERLARSTATLLGRGLRVTGAALGRRGGRVARSRTARRRLGVVALLTATAATALAVLPGPLLTLAAAPLGPSVDGAGRAETLDQRSELVAADGTRLTLLHDEENRRVVALADIPEVMRAAVLAAEDHRFWEHDGYDGRAMVRAAMANLRAGGVTQGASTITQQLAKRNFTGDDRSFARKAKELLYAVALERRSFARKAKELLYAVALERRFTKEQLLERYLNEVYFGSGAFGVATASQELLATDVAELSAAQAALLAGLIRAPAELDPRANPEAATARRNEVLDAMAARGDLAPEEAAAARAAPLGVVPSQAPEQAERYVVEAVVREFLASPAFGETEDDRRELLLTGGLRVQTTLDPRLQEAARAVARRAPAAKSTALVAVDPRSGQVRALYNSGPSGEAPYDMATLGRRQPGSAFKPLVAVAAVEAGMPRWQQLEGDGPVLIDYPGAPERWEVANFAGADHGSVNLEEALVASVNTAMAQLTVALGTDRVAEVAERLGIDVEAAMGAPEERGPAIGLGGLARGVSPLELASAYGTLVAGGERVTPHLLASVTTPDGEELYRAEARAERAVEPAVASRVVDMLQRVVVRGTGWRAQLPGWEPIGKTGTSEGGADAWFAGAVPSLSTAVWVGEPSRDEPAGLTGGTHAAPIWQEFMAEALRTVEPADSGSSRPDRADDMQTRPLDLPVARPCGDECRRP